MKTYVSTDDAADGVEVDGEADVDEEAGRWLWCPWWWCDAAATPTAEGAVAALPGAEGAPDVMLATPIRDPLANPAPYILWWCALGERYHEPSAIRPYAKSSPSRGHLLFHNIIELFWSPFCGCWRRKKEIVSYFRSPTYKNVSSRESTAEFIYIFKC